MRTLDRYAEQLWITLFAKAPEITLFDLRQMLYPLRKETRAPWQGQGTSFDFDAMMQPVTLPGKPEVTPTTMARAAGYTFEKIDKFLGSLGKPLGVRSYKPYHSTGEEFLHNFMGMAGIPMDVVPRFPDEDPVVFLTEAAAADPQISEKIKKHLREGKTAVITTGLLKALQGKGIEDIAEIRCTGRKALVRQFTAGWGPASFADRDILIPQVAYLTNDSWEEISALDDTHGWPILHYAGYSKGKLYILTIPDNFVDLYFLPVPVLNRIRQTIAGHLPVQLEGPGYVSLFAYDNNTFIVESFADTTVSVNLTSSLNFSRMTNLETGEVSPSIDRTFPAFRNNPARTIRNFPMELKPHSFIVLKAE